MKTRILQPKDTGHEMICDEYRGTEIKSINDIFETITVFKNEFTNHEVLATLDDLGQAQYTSMHATMSHDLDEIEGHDLSRVDSVAFEDGEHIGYLSTKSEFFIREKNFLSKARSIDYLSACSVGLKIDEDEMDVLEKIHTTPLDYIDSEILIKVVPVQSSALAVSAFPNGYFSCDLNPFHNYALAKHLEKNYGYELFGLGASLIGFKRQKPLDISLSGPVSKDLARLYNRENDKSVIDRFSKLTQNFNYLFLKYVEYLEY